MKTTTPNTRNDTKATSTAARRIQRYNRCRLPTTPVTRHMSDKEKWQAIEQFARKVVSIKDYDVFLFAVW